MYGVQKSLVLRVNLSAVNWVCARKYQNNGRQQTSGTKNASGKTIYKRGGLHQRAASERWTRKVRVVETNVKVEQEPTSKYRRFHISAAPRGSFLSGVSSCLR